MKDISNTSYSIGTNNSFCVFKSINDILNLIYTNKDKFFKEDFTFSFITTHEGEKHWIEFNDIDDYQQPLMIIKI